MKTEIKSVTVVSQPGTHYYAIGKWVNDMLIDRIVDNSKEYPDSIEFIYEGLTSENEVVFSVINAPVDIEYFKKC